MKLPSLKWIDEKWYYNESGSHKMYLFQAMNKEYDCDKLAKFCRKISIDRLGIA